MALEVGTTLGPYEIVSSVGAGGMDDVYKARDTRLERTVAIKVLPSHLSDCDALTRLTFNGGYAPVWTPDDRRVAFASNWPPDRPDGMDLFWKSADGTGQQELIMAEDDPLSEFGSITPFSWSPDARTLVFRQAMPVVTEPGLQPATPALLFEGAFEAGGYVHNYDVSPDGERFVMVLSARFYESTSDRVLVVLNWLDELERRVPVN